MQRNASAEWRGDLKQGKGTISVGSGALHGAPYSFSSRFEEQKATNPEELIAAAHAGCFAMAFSAQLSEEGMKPNSVQVSAHVSLEQQGSEWSVTQSDLEVFADVPGASREKIEPIAQKAKQNCPISRALKIPISMQLEVRAV